MKNKTMIKQTKQTLLVLGLALGLTHCASMVSQADKADRSGIAKVLGETAVTRNAKECKNGVILSYLEQHNSGNVDVLARAVLSETPFEKDFDLYGLMGLRHTAFDSEVKYGEIEVVPPVAEINIILSTDKTESAPSEGQARSTRSFSRPSEIDSEEPPRALTQITGLHGQTIYSLEEKAQSVGVVCSVKSYDEKAPVFRSVLVSLDGEEGQLFRLPTPILSTEVKTIPVLKGEAGKSVKFKIQPSKRGFVNVMFNNKKAKGEGKRYEMQIPSPENGEIEVPLKDVPAGKYSVLIQRMEKNTAQLAEDLTACVDTMIFVKSNLTVTKPQEEASDKK